jgi:hypothetical protein
MRCPYLCSPRAADAFCVRYPGAADLICDSLRPRSEYDAAWSAGNIRQRTDMLLACLQMDGCGVSPIDSFVYCVAGIGTSCSDSQPQPVLIRLGSSHQDASDASFVYVAVLPCRDGVPFSGGFDSSGAYHIIYSADAGNAALYVLDSDKRPDTLEGFQQHNAAGIADLTSILATGAMPSMRR